MIENEDILKKLNDLIPNAKSNLQNYTASILEEAADTIEKLRNSKVTCGECKNNYHCIIQDLIEGYGKLPDNPDEFFCYYGQKEDESSLVSVPSHKNLIDRTELWVEINKICDRRDAGIITDLTCLQQILSALRHASTIIPTEKDI